MRKLIGKIGSKGYEGGSTPQEASDRFAEMLRSRQAPGAKTGCTLTSGCGTLAQQFEKGAEGQLKGLIKHARANGYEPKTHDVYMDSLARFCGDPQAFVPQSDPMGHIKRVCSEWDVDCFEKDGTPIHRRQRFDPVEEVDIAPDIVESLIVQEEIAQPEVKRIPREKRRAAVKERHTWKRSKLKDAPAPMEFSL